MNRAKHDTRDEGPTLVMTPEVRGNRLVVPKAKLLVVSGPLQGREYVIDRDVFSIGSDAHNHLAVDDSTVSRRHCEIRLVEGGYRIRDLGSTNGTRVQGIKVTEAFLEPGTEFQLGRTRLVFCPLQESAEYPLSSRESFGKLLGRSPAMRRVFYLAETYAPTDATILIEGETGTGKELLAEAIHQNSPRRDKPFVVIDCATLAKDLIESELFGHVKGAFTGAATERIGAFEHADGGTVFLDEISELAPPLQPKLLRVLERREIRRIGSNQARRIDVRILCATNRMLDVEVNEGRFREDLFFRLSVVRLQLPPLRERKDDIPLLAAHFLREFYGADALAQVEDFDPSMEALKRHDWPGNVRELRNLIEIASYSGQRPINLAAAMFLGRVRPLGDATAPEFTADRPFKEAKSQLIAGFEKDYVSDLLRRCDGNISRAAREAGIERAYLQRLIKKYGLKSQP
jgi:DNA-binding NtrC family response regulator